MNVRPEDSTPVESVAESVVESVVASVQVSILIVVYRTPEFLRRCLDSIEAAKLRPSYEVLVLENDPPDDACRQISSGRAHVRYLSHEKNLGYGRAVNRGISLARGQTFLVLNPDIEVRPGSVESLLALLEKEPDVGLVAPRLHYGDGSLQESCRTFYTFPIFLLRRTFLGKLFPNSRIIRDHLLLDWDHESTRNVDWCIGAALLARKAAVQDVGPMDERFFLYFEDVDWCFRMHQRGWRVVYHPESRMIHHYQRASAGWRPGKGLWIHLGSTLRFYEKWSFLLYWLKLRSAFFRRAALFLSDMTGVVLAFVLAYGLRSLASGLLTKPLFAFESYHRFLLFAVVVAAGSFVIFGLYRERRRASFLEHLFPVARALLWTSILMMASTFLFSVRTYSRVVVVLFFPLAVLLVTLGRVLLLRMVESVRERDLNLRRVGILGPPEAVADLEARFSRYGRFGMEPVLIAANPGENLESEDPHALRLRLRAERVQEVILFEERGGDLPRLLAALREEGLPVRLIPRLRAVVPPDSSLTNFLGLPAMRLGTGPERGLRNPGRRLIDLLSALGIAVLWALPFLGWTLSRRLAGRPITERVTVRGRSGQSLGLRRLTGVGSEAGFFRTLLASYPTLPTLVGGGVSLVGIYPFIEDEWMRLDPSYRAAPPGAAPGLLGPWTGRRLPADELARWNERYLQHWSPVEDFRIFWRALRGNRGTEGEAV